jgi:hypothetical protein
MAKVIIYLRDNERNALHELAQQEYRAPNAQAALIIRQELQRRGMIPAEVITAGIVSPSHPESAEHLPSIPAARTPKPSGLITESEA